MKKTDVVFVHGFMSGRGSSKWSYLQSLDYIQPHIVEFEYREIDPLTVIGTLGELVDSLDDPIVVGHSLGGFFARAIRLRRSVRSLLINPSLRPDTTLFNGGERSIPYEYLHEYWSIGVDNLVDGLPVEIPAEIILVEYGDTVVNHYLNSEYYVGSQVIGEFGGSHSYERLNNIDIALQLLINRPWQ